jgi:4a-hydroxytetrahydrobiopterin dehydratase
VPSLKGEEIKSLISQLSGWSVVEEHHLSKSYRFPDFVQALKFVNKLGEIAEREWHHPDLYLAWGQVKVEIWTHKINGLTESDFIFAAKTDQAYSS